MGVRTNSPQRVASADPAMLASPDGQVYSIESCTGFVTVPASGGTALTVACRGLAITVAGNLGVKLADGTDNNSNLIPVTTGQIFPFCVLQFTAGNTAGAIGLQ